ncbi:MULTISPECIES: YjgB family protein [Bacillus cereus group]|uniref:YjgB family protein n=1 Tax=Bacillus cereus group TaxID=86661 RepID=UPI001F5995AF|nr:MULTISPECIES: YjgB family protein [Bacillus cereus group]MDH2882681.1 YjgB family protein [Bacillus cytotoxicus]
MKKLLILMISFICVCIITACKSADEQKPPTETSKQTTSNQANEKKNETTKQSSESEKKEVGTKQDTSSTSTNFKTVTQIKNILEQAKQGKVPNVSVAAHTGDIEEVEKEWGKADKTEPAGKGMYATYTKRNVVIGFNKGSQIFDVRSNHPNLRSLTLQDIENALGKPTTVKTNGDDKIYIYKVNKQFELKFVIPNSTGKVDHISVFSPEDSMNNMSG